MIKHALATLIVLGTIGGRSFAQDQGPTAQAMVDPSRVVLVVNGEEIKGAEYYRRMEYLPNVGRQMGATFSEFPPGFLTIQELINERLIFQLAKDKGVFPSDEEVDAELKIRESDNPGMLKQWFASGGNMEELRYQLRFQISQFKLQTFGITITDEEVEKDYRDRPDTYKIPRQLKLRLIAVQSADDTKAVDAELAGGKSFADVAKEKSVDVTKSLGGEFGTVPDYTLSTATSEALKTVKIGETTQWLTTTPEGGAGTYIKFLLEDVIPEKKMELDATLRRMIRRKLMADRGNIKNSNVAKELDTLRMKAKIDIKQPEFADAYAKFMKTYLKQHGESN